MTGIPTPYVLPLQRWQDEGGYDAHGNPTSGYGDPEDWHVHGFAPAANEIETIPNRDLSTVQWTVYAPVTDNPPHERDLVTLPDGNDYQVRARPEDWSYGPWPFPNAGITVFLEDKEG